MPSELEATVVAAGFTDFEILDKIDVFKGAPGEDNARTFETFGVTYEALKSSS